ncbi:hypothetical protein H310_01345 [Aphanomyces invadans]|uniref:D-isomer specific 2-hydroxyacid dehydrogenase NAD-binding domain-containing protein n=1 Tax=Aphanomyces invadans TaxID=157072 RepID=A0A024UQW6_9STRA|nr:hypothetical protein H310_01345 [Aphanomyces invadans]ETW08841.1 hypothetical protein H310_01345 [Aphanomyces invadans]|eukprot:XP_008862646.1 hypothetical protein H310_01345 [Aphanomyces invadans]
MSATSMRIPVISNIPLLSEKVRAALALLPSSTGAVIDVVPVNSAVLSGPGSIDVATLELLRNAKVILGDPKLVISALPHAPRVEWVQSTFAGVEVILTQPRRDFTLSRAGGIMGQHMAQYVLGWIISKERMFHLAPVHQANKEFRSKDMRYRHFQNVTVGILGFGDIGTVIATLVSTAGFRVIGLKRSSGTPSGTLTSRIPTTTDLHEVLSVADYVVNVLPSTEQTRNLLSGNAFQACQTKKPCFINVGRGDVVDEASLVVALDKSWLSSAVLDVFAVEPLPAESALWVRKDVVITPHVAALSMPEDVAGVFARNLSHFQAGESLEYTFKWSHGY